MSILKFALPSVLLIVLSVITQSAGAGPKGYERQRRDDLLKRTPGGDEVLMRSKIVRFAQARLGQQVGDGECWTLAAEAFKVSGARAPNSYDFGRVMSIGKARSGDVIQFTSAKFVSGNSWSMMGAPNHTAIIESINGNVANLLQQNTNGNRTVSRQTLNLGTKTEGSFKIYRGILR